MRALALTRATLRRVVRDRTALFFLVVLPIAVIVLVGLTVRGVDQLRVGLVRLGSGPLSGEVARGLEHTSALDTTTFHDLDAARTSLRRSELVALVVLPADLDARLAGGRSATVTLYARGGSADGPAAASAVSAVVARTAARVQAARFAQQAGVSLAEGLAAADRAAGHVTPVRVRSVTVDTGSRFLPQGFSYSAPTMLVLFVFVNALAGGAAIIETRRLGIYARALAAPVGARDLVLGETLGYLAITLLQSLLIVAVGAVFFGVSWGNPLAAAALVVTWALVGTGAGVLSGSLFRTPEQASAIGPALGIAAGMLGGCMWPLAIVPSAMRTLGHLLPHAWAVDAWTDLLSRHGDLGSIAGRLGVLLGFAAGLLSLATWRLHRRMLG